MAKALDLIAELPPEDIDWFFTRCEERPLAPEERLITEGESPRAMYVLLEGLVGVSVSADGRPAHLTCGAGELFGEMSFLTRRPAVASVYALEASRVLAIPLDTITERIEDDPAFSSRLYRAIALVLEQRLRRLDGGHGAVPRSRPHGAAAPSSPWTETTTRLDVLKGQLRAAEKAALGNEGEIPDEIADETRRAFVDFYGFLNDLCFGDDPPSPQTCKAIGTHAQQELLPYVLLTEAHERAYAKPRGYPGDFLLLDMFYRNAPGGTGRLGPLIDEAFLSLPAAKGVRNRRVLVGEEVEAVVQACADRPAKVTCIASGPASEIFDVFGRLDNPRRLEATLVDIDIQGLAFVGQKMEEKKLKRQIRLFNANLIYLATGRQEIDTRDQDLVYSIGLLDYLEDKFAVMLINYLHTLLRPGGKILLGNFHPSNPSRAMMEYIVEWDLIHRTKEDMDRLYLASNFARPTSRVRFEGEKLNLFAECVKQA